MKTQHLVSALFILLFSLNLSAQPVSSFSKISEAAVLPTANVAGQTVPSQAALPLFGADIFSNTIGDAILLAGSLPTDYQLGPGDYLGIYLGNKAQQYFDIRISVDGQLFIPNVGVMYVNGLNMDEFKVRLDRKLRAFYSNYSLQVILIEPKYINVNIAGEVKTPGSYIGNGLKSVLDFIALAHGVTGRGALRNIQVFRADSLVQKIDLYDFMLRPAMVKHFCLQNGDKIFVPVAQEHVYLMGEIYRPAQYELNPNVEERLSDVIELGGGFTATSYRNHVELIRTKSTGETVISQYDMQTKSADSLPLENPVVQGMDRIMVYSAQDFLPQQTVSIYGDVNDPGTYTWQEDMHVSNLIYRAGNIKRSAYMLFAEVARIDPNKAPDIHKVNLEFVFNGDPENDLKLEPDDKVFIRRIPEWDVGPTVEVLGEVSFPGVYPIVKDSTKLSEILFKAGGFTKDALVNQTRLIRSRTVMVEDKEFQRLSQMSRNDMTNMEYEYYQMKLGSEYTRDVVVDFDRLVYQGDKSQDVILRRGDMLVVPRKPDVVFVSGQVARPGGVIYEADKGVRYYINKAGGFSYDARKHKIRVVKVNGEILDEDKVDELLPGDRIWIPRKREVDYWDVFYKTIMVFGQLAAIYLVINNASN